MFDALKWDYSAAVAKTARAVMIVVLLAGAYYATLSIPTRTSGTVAARPQVIDVVVFEVSRAPAPTAVGDTINVAAVTGSIEVWQAPPKPAAAPTAHTKNVKATKPRKARRYQDRRPAEPIDYVFGQLARAFCL